MEVQCKKETCKKEWDYQGKNKTFATCPDCRSLVKLDDGYSKGNQEKD